MLLAEQHSTTAITNPTIFNIIHPAVNGTAGLVLFQMSERKNFLARTAKAKLWVTLGFKHGLRTHEG